MNSGTDINLISVVVFILRQVHIAVELAAEHKNHQTELWTKIWSDEYMGYAVLETFQTLEPCCSVCSMEMVVAGKFH